MSILGFAFDSVPANPVFGLSAGGPLKRETVTFRPLDLPSASKALDIDHVEPLKVAGKDDSSNFALLSFGRQNSSRPNKVLESLAHQVIEALFSNL